MRRAALFVDDEQRVLDGLRRGLRGLRHEWDLRFALGGEAAVEALDDALTVVVSDMRMPGLDGVDVLLAARDRAPRAARIILSGNSDRLAARRAAFVAHRFVAKPCDAATLSALLPALSRCVESADGVAAFAAPPACADTVDRVRSLLDRGAPLADVARLVHEDPGLSLALLHVASSAFFAPAAACRDVVAAVEHVGPLVVRELLDEPALPTRATRPWGATAAATSTVGALAGLAHLVPTGVLLPALELWGLTADLVADVQDALRGEEAA
ncbi:MAG: hypothetical protein JWO60_1509 [Frankiales bacterium]|nr:hypothetical protein [Frankiales bacterium]